MMIPIDMNYLLDESHVSCLTIEFGYGYLICMIFPFAYFCYRFLL